MKDKQYMSKVCAVDQDCGGVEGLTVTATLFAGRSDNPDLIPGAVVPGFANKTLEPPTWLDSYQAGDYHVAIGDEVSFDPPAGSGYVVVVDSRRSDGSVVGRWEKSVAVVVSS
jgi:hypothetical protein